MIGTVILGFWGASFVGALLFLFLAGRNNIKDEEWLFLRAYSVLTNLKDYIADRDHHPHFKNQAKKKLRGLLTRLEREWATGGSKLETNALAPLERLKSGLYQLVAAVEKGQQMELSREIMAEFCEFLLKENPRMQDLGGLNSKLSVLGTIPAKRTKYAMFLAWFKYHSNLRVAIPGILAIVSGPILFILMISYGFTKEIAVGPAVGASVGFTGVYVTWLAAQSYLKRKSP
jgi:hypothetical protein